MNLRKSGCGSVLLGWSIPTRRRIADIDPERCACCNFRAFTQKSVYKIQKAATDCTNYTNPIMPERGAICEICGDSDMSFLISMASYL